ncbi:hypothetical protein I2I11_20270 [Pontibacter sp. 172403-2]|uniref:DUF6933 domain-containing protein n=1 Tax=Pontibacter rufus TaxID=2791028 RepID=UPI0018B012D6|nr:hypothetical protein [Pontibacter sp. 172403-2]MBF9255644.1 hypothetical protein [Pontibacter sp. 172403-2]
MIKLYQTKRLSGNLSPSFCRALPDVSAEAADPLLSWYGDMFFLARKANLLFTNELTKFSFPLLGYRKAEHPDFAATFRACLARTLQLHGIPPGAYLEQAAEFGRNAKSNRSPLAHISRLKIDFVPSLKAQAGFMGKEGLWRRCACDFNTFLTSYPGGTGYAAPAEMMREELEKRQLL